MGTHKKAGHGKRAADSTTQYIKRVLEDEKVRKSLTDAVHASHQAYGRVRKSNKSGTKALHDRKVKRDLKSAAESLRDAAEAMKRERKKRRRPILKILFAAIVATTLALVLSEKFRQKVLDLLFGAEEEFEYTSPTVAAETNGAVPESAEEEEENS